MSTGWRTFYETDINVSNLILIVSQILNQSRLEFHREPGLARGSFDVDVSNTLSSIRKFAEDNTVSEILPKFGASMLQNTIHDVLGWSNDNRFKVNSLKRKELRIDFRRESNLDTDSLKANGIAFEIAKSAKILGLTVRNDLKWKDHLDNVTAKAS